MEHIQFTAIVLMTLLMLKLILLPARVAVYPAVNKSRWLITFGTALLALHFLLQFTLDLRSKGITQSVMLNLAMFIPCSYAFSLAIILLQRQGRIKKIDKFFGGGVWILAMTLILIACAVDGKPLLSDSPEKHVAEVAASICYGLMLLYYFWRHLSFMKAMRTTLQNYFDWNMDDQLRWIQISIIILASVGLTMPFIIFGAGKWLAPYVLLCFGSYFYFIDCFCTYVMSTIPKKLQEAKESQQQEHSEELKDNKQKFDADTMDRIERSVEKWVSSGRYLQSGVKLPSAATEIGIPQYLLSGWLRSKKLKYSEWITDLRISEAKRVITEHPDWNNEAVALHCGFNDRSYFQTIFKKKVGMTPAEYVQTTQQQTTQQH